MGKRGPAPTPTAELERRGSWRAKARKKQGEPTPSTKRPACPNWLDANARAEWRKRVKMAEDMGVLGEGDGNALAVYCQAWSDYRRLTEFLNENGSSYETAGGTWREYPEAKRRDRVIADLLRYGARFGFTPADRANVRVERKESGAGKGKSRFFEGGGAAGLKKVEGA